ncbi:sulfur oxidation c-type cytochrome SoxA [Tropicimonas sp. TH_r6]|uniref:sulfur oxidation c-type cytochrome SoxA n=1 Tax=Tropicimonas sp. TH_r6 TaxID=3082085 RepID=UPI0029545C35|nr:sulfur oxidation c-type cytochrome SoxA [Tropicimonas sp. TH_r6]MDV7142934.1 sulfur oxidation c-type cytochrome SoxA [Tropicimonas sp. TH_r6]
MKFKAMTALAGALALSAGFAAADADDDTLTINEEIEIVTKTDAPEYIDGLSELISGWHFRSDETQQLEMDDFDNPGMLGVEAAMDSWAMAEGSEGKSCADCHESAEETMVGVRTVYPKWNDAAEAVWTLEMAINGCRTERMGAEAWKYDGADITNMVALISSVSRGMPMSVAVDGPAEATWEEGKELYYTRTGQLELSCANCHEDNYGNMIRADHLSQGHTNGFPAYRLKNAKLNSVHARFKGCVRDTRAETYAPGSPEFVALELYVASRGNGLSVEGPSVRN